MGKSAKSIVVSLVESAAVFMLAAEEDNSAAAGRVMLGEAKAEAAAADCRKTCRRLDVDVDGGEANAAVESNLSASSRLLSSTPLVTTKAVTVRTEECDCDCPEPP